MVHTTINITEVNESDKTTVNVANGTKNDGTKINKN